MNKIFHLVLSSHDSSVHYQFTGTYIALACSPYQAFVIPYSYGLTRTHCTALDAASCERSVPTSHKSERSTMTTDEQHDLRRGLA